MSGILNNPLSNSGGSSIPLAAGQGVGAPANPLDTIGKFAGIQNALNQNKMFPGALRLQGQEIQSNQLALAQRLKQTAYQHLAAGVADGSISDIGSATSALASLEHNYGIPTDGVIQDITNLGGNGPDFQSRLKGLVVANTQKPENAVTALAPSPVTVDQGLNLGVFNRGAPGTQGQGQLTPAGSVPLGAGPGTQGAPVQWKDPSGAEHFGTWAQYNVELGNGRVNGPAVSVAPGAAPGGGQPGALFGGSNGRYPSNPALRAPGAATASPPPAPAPSFTGPSPGTVAAGVTTGTQSAEKFQNVAAEGTAAKEQDAVLANMQNDLQNFASGPGAHNYNELQKVIQGWIPGANNAFKTKIAAQESFDKLANQLVTTASPGSDARQAVIQGATPNSAQSPEGVDFILRQLRGMTDYKLARANLAAGAPNKGDYAGWQSTAGNSLNPAVFQFARLTPEQKATYLNGIPAGSQRESFKQQYLAAQRAGFYGVNNGGQ